MDHVIRLFFSLKYDLLYRLGLDGICSSTLNWFPSVPHGYINKLPIRGSKLCIKLMITNIEVQMGIFLKEKY